ncbi:pyrimidine reductase family protein [Agromyces protaetiae]|uniref:pyrimidine reductase family protein n=1 Tax=Agromyces protaetiae TaxID=2509455 RepID=UPI0013E9C3BE|nr:pyrimidine reductase family protein [Agromyces protaetiae]
MNTPADAAASPVTRDSLLAAYAFDDRATPCVRMNFVSSLDGAVTIDGRSGGLGDAADRLALCVIRTLADVVLVGAGTVRAEGYGGVEVGADASAWRVTHGLEPQPRIAVVSRDLDLDPAHPFFAEAVTRPILVTCAGDAGDSGARAGRLASLEAVADVLVAGEQLVDLSAALDALADQGLRQVLCEGGPHLFGALLEADLVDELCLSLSPLLVGGAAGRIVQGASEASRAMRLVHAIPAGDLLLLRYARLMHSRA